MIMVLSCCDLLVVLTNHPMTALRAMLWLTEKINVYPAWILISQDLLRIFLGFSLLVLFVMNVDQYLATHYPILHRTTVTKEKLFTLFTFMAVIIEITLVAMSINNLFIPYGMELVFLYFLSVLFLLCCFSTANYL